ncbi:tetratricopeptide repeat protein [Ichthyophthirius multifiliis]|uniref:Tetratricopeptide repeat protein n=1 Tax=Ichthyophthirius multifiliis TaxID=5932 RepID=G0QU20_ICHMU|nr:tetratricopeptide repeat protein [Ichthyophthirius multifiliis]EGR31287.1 tetratricopeptide repeat protein [Ichthyophthirius multifiliis]|eukprot:XP_004034773.1 tetratricopeptide repeat protein [Ichthyophthirius multifiliis]
MSSCEIFEKLGMFEECVECLQTAGHIDKAKNQLNNILNIKAFQKAVAINKYTPDPWFTMGCAYMKLNDLKNATNCFSTVVSIDEQQGESWANLSGCLMKQGKKLEAYSTLDQAVKYCERNWRIWQNLLYISLSNKKFYKYFECIERITGLGHKDVVDFEALSQAYKNVQKENIIVELKIFLKSIKGILETNLEKQIEFDI